MENYFNKVVAFYRKAKKALSMWIFGIDQAGKANRPVNNRQVGKSDLVQ